MFDREPDLFPGGTIKKQLRFGDRELEMFCQSHYSLLALESLRIFLKGQCLSFSIGGYLHHRDTRA